MQKKHVIAATAALIAVVGLATASLTGFFDAGTNVDFIAKTSGPQLLLPSADKKELRRLRTNNPDGSANDIVELANGYLELREPGEQRARFVAVNALREALGAPALPLDEEFLAELASPPGLPACVGVALGLDRLVMLACGRSRLSDVTLTPGAA